MQPQTMHAWFRRVGPALALLGLIWGGRAHAVPSFAEQTGQPCAACHVGAFGPQLRPFGRSFKLNGYTASDGGKHFPPLAAMTILSFNHTQADQPPLRWYAPNNNFSLDQVSLYYAGAIDRHLGAFVQLTYDGDQRQLQIDNTDIRYARERTIFGIDSVWGLTLNNNPTVSDLWNSTPAWGFPYNSSSIAATPAAAVRLDGSFAEQVLGIGGYAMWNDWVYTELALYRGLGRDIRNATGIVPVANTDSIVGTMPYWRLAVQHDMKRHNWEFGTYGLIATVLPAGIAFGDATDRYIDTAIDANYQFTFNPGLVASDVISAHATAIHEDQKLAASSQIDGAAPHGHLDTARADISYSIRATFTPSVQLFSTSGSRNVNFWPTPTGRPNSSGGVVEMAYTPFGKADSSIHFGNIRFAVQYVFYTRFDGQAQGASGNNTLYCNIWAAWHF